MHLSDILLGAGIVCALIAAIGAMNKKSDSGCSGSCSACSMASNCHKDEKQ